MGYSDCEGAVQTILQGLTDFDDEDVTRGDYRVLDRGSPPYVVLTPGPFDREQDTYFGGLRTHWTVVVDLFVRHWGDGTEWTNLQTHRQTVIDRLDDYLQLDYLSNVRWSLLETGEDPLPVYDEAGGGPHFLMQRMRLRVCEKKVATGGEYA